MSHFSAAEWFEFARDSISPAAKDAMQLHLEQGCEECRSERTLCMEVLEICRREISYEPPEPIVGSAKAAFKPTRSWTWLRQVAEAATVLFDSFRQPLAEATRGAAASSRQLLEEAKPFVIDLRVESEPARNQVRIIGQVLNSSEPDKPVQGVEVFLFHGDNLAANSKANASGEFSLECKAEPGMQLLVDIRGQKVVEIRLPSSPAEGH